MITIIWLSLWYTLNTVVWYHLLVSATDASRTNNLSTKDYAQTKLPKGQSKYVNATLNLVSQKFKTHRNT